MTPAAEVPQRSPAAVPTSAAGFGCPANEETDQPQQHGDDQHVPEHVDREAEPAEDRKQQQQYDKRNHHLSLVSLDRPLPRPLPVLQRRYTGSDPRACRASQTQGSRLARRGRDESPDEVERGLRDLPPTVVDGQRVA